MAAASAAPLFQLTGSYFLRAFDTVHNLDNGTVQLTGASSYSIPDTVYSLSDTFGGGYRLTAYAEIFGSIGIDGGHCCYEKVDNTISSVYSMDIGSAYSVADFSAFDTITPTSATLANGTPVVFTLTGWAEGAFSPAGLCPVGSFGFSGSFGSFSVSGCPGGPFQGTASQNRTVFIGTPFQVNWALHEGVSSAIGYFTDGLEEGMTLQGQNTDGFNIQPQTAGVSFTSASGARYDSTPSPEPGGFALFCIGVVGLSIIFRRRRGNA